MRFRVSRWAPCCVERLNSLLQSEGKTPYPDVIAAMDLIHQVLDLHQVYLSSKPSCSIWDVRSAK